MLFFFCKEEFRNMIDSVLAKRSITGGRRVAVKSVVSAVVIALAVLLPQLVHSVAGVSGGIQWLPMYLPVLIGGCLLGVKWGLCVGILSPVASFLLTLAFGNPMPAAARLPYIVIELAVFAAVAGLFSRKIAKSVWWTFPAVIAAAVAGRCVFLLCAVVFRHVAVLSPTTAWTQVVMGLRGLLLQIVLVPAITVCVSLCTGNKK